MNYDEFTSYLADRIVAIRNLELRPGVKRRPERYYDAAYNAVFECRSFFDRFSLDEGPHNDYNPNSRASVEAYRAAMYSQMAAALGNKAAGVCLQGDIEFLDSVLVHAVKYGERVSVQRFARVAAEYLSNIVFERTCAGCGSKYKVAVKAQTYRMVSNHPATCGAVPADLNEQLENKLKNSSAPVIPQELFKPTQKYPYNSPAYRANVKAALRLYADFLKFYDQSPLVESDSEENQHQMERIYSVVVRTVFNFDPDASKKNQ